ncbi:MAG TPA: YheC/YheD family protein [Candidatus Bathyarchaeia archaeon]|nr:YheC/YheD family protein [Candidatus Bathyarchaeia archaeon]
MKKFKKIVVVYKGDDWKKKLPLEKHPTTRESFEDWHERGLARGVEMFRASIQWYDEKKNVFRKTWAYRDKKWLKSDQPIKPDLIFDKIAGKFDYDFFEQKLRISRRVKIFNSPLFRTIFDNKLNQYIIFKDFMPASYLADSKRDLIEGLKKIKSKKVVLKPFYGSGGFGITITEKKKAASLKLEYPILVQEFVKSNKGVPGFSKKSEVADLRMVFFNHKLIYALSRIAKRGSLFTNFHQGATAVLVPEKNIPQSAKKIVTAITSRMKIFPQANYSIDLIYTNAGKPVLMEINTTPGFDLLHLVGNEKIKNKNFLELTKVLE